jgi:hypothetical protein
VPRYEYHRDLRKNFQCNPPVLMNPASAVLH